MRRSSHVVFQGLGDEDFPLRILQHEDDVKQARRSCRGRRDDGGMGEQGWTGGGEEEVWRA